VQNTFLCVAPQDAGVPGGPGGWLVQELLMGITRWRIADQFRKRTPAERLRHHKSAAPDPGTEGSTATEERVADPRRNLLEAVWERGVAAELVAHRAGEAQNAGPAKALPNPSTCWR